MSRELEAWIADLGKAGDGLHDEARHVVEKGALNVKKDARERWQGMPHAPSLPWAVGYDITDDETTISAEIGPDKDMRQGALGNLLEYGSINNAPRPALNPALDVEEPRFVQAVEDLGEQLLAGKT